MDDVLAVVDTAARGRGPVTARVLPQVERAEGLPERVTVWEVGARDGLQNEPTAVPPGRQARVPRPPRRRRATRPRGDQLRPPGPGAPAGRRRGPDAPAGPTRRRALPGAGAQRARPGPRPGCGGARRGRVRLGHRDLRPAQPQPRPRRPDGDVRPGRDPGPGRGPRRPRLPVHVLRRPVGGSRPGRPGRRGGTGPARPRLHRAVAGGHHRRRDARARPRASCPPAAGPASAWT